MITEERQQYLFDKLIDSLNDCHSKKIFLNKPVLEEYNNENLKRDKDDPNWEMNRIFTELAQPNNSKEENVKQNIQLTNEQRQHLFDVLGCFNSAKPDRVFLFPDRINQIYDTLISAKDVISFIEYNRPITVRDLAEVVYIHECAHYIHFHINCNNFLEYNAKNRKFYLESFAQLLTHRLVCSASEFHLLKILFIRLSEGQDKAYTYYKTGNFAFHLSPVELVFQYFLIFNKQEMFVFFENEFTNLVHEYKLKETDSEKLEIVNAQVDLLDVGLSTRSDVLKLLTTGLHTPAWSVSL
jgi:hypothetical protein